MFGIFPYVFPLFPQVSARPLLSLRNRMTCQTFFSLFSIFYVMLQLFLLIFTIKKIQYLEKKEKAEYFYVINLNGGKMSYAFAVDKEKKLAPTLGKADFLLILDGKVKSGAEKLFCGGIGNCSCMLLENSGTEILCGCKEKALPSELLEEYFSGNLTRDKECFCTSSGRSCGECPGKF